MLMRMSEERISLRLSTFGQLDVSPKDSRFLMVLISVTGCISQHPHVIELDFKPIPYNYNNMNTHAIIILISILRFRITWHLISFDQSLLLSPRCAGHAGFTAKVVHNTSAHFTIYRLIEEMRYHFPSTWTFILLAVAEVVPQSEEQRILMKSRKDVRLRERGDRRQPVEKGREDEIPSTTSFDSQLFNFWHSIGWIKARMISMFLYIAAVVLWIEHVFLYSLILNLVVSLFTCECYFSKTT